MRHFVNQRGELLGLRLARKQSNLAAVGDSKGRGDLLVEFQLDVLLREKCNHPVAVFAHFAGDVVLKLRQFRTFGLAEVLSRDLRPAAGLPREPAQPGVRHHGDRVKPSKSGRIRRSVNGRVPCE